MTVKGFVSMKVFFFTSLYLLGLSACVSVPPATGGALFYNDYESNYLTFQDQQGPLTGTSDATCYAMLVCLGDTSIYTAAKSVEIKKISSVEYRYKSIFIFYSKTTIIVKGF
ncbi:MAG: hypothetical protein O9301_05480 [Leptospira sp.]|nr:hypothetical protein [Leptospira sp.]